MDLEGYILILPHVRQNPGIEKIRVRLSKTFGFDTFTICSCTASDISTDVKYSHYEEFKIKVEVIFHLASEENIQKERIIRLFSEENPLAEIGESWLYLNAFLVKDIFHETKPKLNSFALGSIVHMNTFVEHYSSVWSVNDDKCKITQPTVRFKHDIRKLQVTFNVTEQKFNWGVLKTPKPFMLELEYNTMLRILVEVPNEKGMNKEGIKFIRLHLVMSGAPLMKAQKSEDPDDYISPEVLDSKTKFVRASQFGLENTDSFCSSYVFGMCRVLCLEIQCSKNNEDVVWDTLTQLSCSCKTEIHFTSMEKRECRVGFVEPRVRSNFNCIYALKTVISTGFSVTDEIHLKHRLREVNQKFNEYTEKCPKAFEQSLFQIQTKLEKAEVIKFVDAVISLVDQYEENIYTSKSNKNLPRNVILLRRVLLTPTRTIFLPPIPHMLSFLLRETNPEYALRITIRDDNFERLKHKMIGSKQNKTKFLRETIGEKLMQGFRIDNREYKFFGASPSQLRENGALFYAKDDAGNTADSIRDSLGKLSKLRNVAQYMARMGQSLSQALYNLKLEKEFVGTIDDVQIKNDKYPDKKYTFSDGIGQMSPELAKECYKVMGLKDDDYKPCAVQIRYGGSKGMLLLNPELMEWKMVLRESMEKFKSSKTSLEILKTSYLQTAFLNRPFITILEQMGVDKTVFFTLQSNHFQQVITSLYNSESAVRFLHEESVLHLPFKRLHQCGVNLSFDPFFRSLIMALYSSTIGLLKTKARIKLPFSEARTMFGVMDETGTLEYGQVFVQYTEKMEDGKLSKEPRVLTGTVLVTKNPCMHPGDVRKFTAVHVERLLHVKDCIVFPQKGPRPHPDEMAGSDLDGDEYCVVWHKPLIFERPTQTAMDYTCLNKPIEQDNIKVQDMVDFICDYIRDDNVGLIASAHLVWADTEGIFSDVCMELARKYSVTLDFAKTGKPEELTDRERPNSYPDFTEKFREKDSYMSMKVLGRLFRNCKSLELLSNVLSTDVPVVVNESILYEGWEKFEGEAQLTLLEYSHLLSTPTQLFHISNEGEILSGAVKKLEQSFQGDNIQKNFLKVLETLIPFVSKKMQTEFYTGFLKHELAQPIIEGSCNEEEALVKLQNYVFDVFIQASSGCFLPSSITPLLEGMLQKASAWYIVAYKCKQEGSDQFLGLPWTIPELMGILHARKKSNILPIQLKITSLLQNNHELQKFLGETPSCNQVQLSKQILKNWVKQMSTALTFSKSEIKELDSILDSAMNQAISSVDVLSVRAEELVARYMTTIVNCSVGFESGNDIGQQPLLRKALGIFMISAISTLASTGMICNIQGNLDKSRNVSGLQFLAREYREEICFPLERGRRLYNSDGTLGHSDFGNVFLQDTTKVKELLERFSKVKINIEFLQKRRFWYVLLSVYGKPLNIETLKDAVIQPSFGTRLIEYVRSDCCIM